MAPKGVGDQSVAFEKLKQKLAAEGLFDEAHKKPIPVCPGRIAVITSITGDAMWDMIRILGQRWPMARIVFLPVAVQGVKAPAELTGAVRYANRWKVADVIILGRGGGSAEDLLAFNDEKLARAIYDSELPVISAVGHEPDVTISDYVADLRAATPSDAARKAVPEQKEVRAHLDQLQLRLGRVMGNQLARQRQKLQHLEHSRALSRPLTFVEEKRMLLDRQQEKLAGALQKSVAAHRTRFAALCAALDSLSPLKVLARGYGLAQRENGSVITAAAQVFCGDHIDLTLSGGTLGCTVTERKLNSDGKQKPDL